jgi:hypothetical protein
MADLQADMLWLRLRANFGSYRTYSITSSARFEQRRRNIEAKRPSRLSVDDQLAPELEAQNIS